MRIHSLELDDLSLYNKATEQSVSDSNEENRRKKQDADNRLKVIQLRIDANLLALVTTELEVLATLQSMLETVLALRALETEHDLLGGLGLRNVKHENKNKKKKFEDNRSHQDCRFVTYMGCTSRRVSV
jgi:hypothetical protein